LLRRREPGVEYYVEHNDVSSVQFFPSLTTKRFFFIVTNADGASNYKVVRVDENDLSSWKTIIPEEQDIQIEDIDMFQVHGSYFCIHSFVVSFFFLFFLLEQ
jgi:protease II